MSSQPFSCVVDANVALSQRVHAPLVTADERLVCAMTGKPFRVFALTALEVPSLPQQ